MDVVLVEGFSKKSENFMSGRNDNNKVLIFPADENVKVGDFVMVKIRKATSATLFGDFLSLVNPDGKMMTRTA